jgi:hypothetical protein
MSEVKFRSRILDAREQLAVHIDWEIEPVSKQSSTLWSRAKSLAPTWNQTVSSPSLTLTTIFRLLSFCHTLSYPLPYLFYSTVFPHSSSTHPSHFPFPHFLLTNLIIAFLFILFLVLLLGFNFSLTILFAHRILHHFFIINFILLSLVFVITIHFILIYFFALFLPLTFQLFYTFSNTLCLSSPSYLLLVLALAFFTFYLAYFISHNLLIFLDVLFIIFSFT